MMRGADVIALVRDGLALEAARVRSLEDQLAGLALPGAPNPERLKLARDLEAGADVMTAIIAAGQAIALRKADPPAWARSEAQRAQWRADQFGRLDELLKSLAGQARAALREDDGDERRERDGAGVGDGDQAGEAYGLAGAA
jgi:hypothetical protein